MSRYIDADALSRQLLNHKILGMPEFNVGLETAREIVREMPTADVEEVRHGEWLESGANYKCSRCGNTESYYIDSYCRACGTRMDGEKEK